MNSQAEMAQSESLIRQAAEWRLLALLFQCPTAAWRNKLADLSPQVRNLELRAVAEHALSEGSEGLYHSVFGPGGPAPPREASYYRSVELGSLMSELEEYYAAFAYQPDPREAVDHVATEIDFVSYLRLKQAYALASADTERALITADAVQAFVADHLASMAEPLAATLRDSGIRYLAHASEALFRLVGPPRKTGSAFSIQRPNLPECDLSCDELI